MNPKKRSLIVVAALLAAILGCNLPLEVETPFPATPTAAVRQPSASATLIEPATGIPPVVQAPTETASVTPPPAATGIPPTTTDTASPTTTLTPSMTSTRTRPPHTPTAPATLTPEPKPTRTRTAKPNPPTRTAKPDPSKRTVFTAVYFSNPPVLDGIWDEWRDASAENPARSVVYGAENWSGSDDLDASFRVAWDDNYLYLAAKVRDDVYAQNAAEANLYLGDSLEILLDRDLFGDLNTRSLSDDDYQLGITPGNPEAGEDPQAYLWFPRDAAGVRARVKIAAVRQEGVTRVEAAIPWGVFGIDPAAGDRYGFAFSASDNDHPNDNAQESMVSSAPRRSLVDPTTWNELRLK